MGNAECGVASPDIPHSALRIPHLLAGVLLLALLPPLAGAQQRGSVPKDTTPLAPVVVTRGRPPPGRELARGRARPAATRHAQGLGARGGRTLADAPEQAPGGS